MLSVVYKGLWWENTGKARHACAKGNKENVLFAAQKASDIERRSLDAERKKKKKLLSRL
jgi:hypothetical protein